MNFDYSSSKLLEARLRLYDLYSSRSQNWFDWLRGNVEGELKPPQILDIGGGKGSVWEGLLPGHAEVLLTDGSAEMLASSVVSEHPNITLKVMDSCNLDVEDRCKDIATAFGVIYHVDNKEEFFSEVSRVLKTSGTFLFTTIGANHLSELRNLVSEVVGDLSDELVALSFPIDDARELALQHFQQVEYEIFPDELLVTERDPLLDYVLSTPAAAQWSDLQINSLKKEIDARLGAGPLKITTEVGLITCRQPRLRLKNRIEIDGCPFCREDPVENEWWTFVERLSTSKLCLSQNQTYRGQCLLIFEGKHAESIEELSEAEYVHFMNDLRHSVKSLQKVFKPDHLNIELLGNVVPHLHFHLIPRYMNDPRWMHPIWTTEIRDMQEITLAPDERISLIEELRAVLNSA